MATEGTEPITGPSSIRETDLTIEICETESHPPTRQVRLAVLQPLTKPSVLAACRNPSSTIVRFPDGRPSGARAHERLYISALSKAWRQAVGRVQRPISLIRFDISLPKSAEPTVSWDTSPARDHAMLVSARDVSYLAVTIATVARMREQGNVSFEVVYDDEGPSRRIEESLKKHLQAIAECGPSSQPESTGLQQASQVEKCLLEPDIKSEDTESQLIVQWSMADACSSSAEVNGSVGVDLDVL